MDPWHDIASSLQEQTDQKFLIKKSDKSKTNEATFSFRCDMQAFHHELDGMEWVVDGMYRVPVSSSTRAGLNASGTSKCYPAQHSSCRAIWRGPTSSLRLVASPPSGAFVTSRHEHSAAFPLSAIACGLPVIKNHFVRFSSNSVRYSALKKIIKKVIN